ncbi:Nramp family divalent metal transporter [Aeromicrobium senzhongii]|uniref:Nramp family divalent metal transporter n=1 Tax=Aeromicrobium senzhongii TaxID=2663859 RepID=A0ABX6SVL8_9ACTN|nr:Nramp family divalent metal transporter [Aeromicrobium senzhongii]MTB88399.1 Mn(2+) uptake NRAMP transporter MntH [Aeromicrobium senzhongii]QNL94632.1 Nramp family divalent metal transporter [Aeromicrobium senzhongii]
MTVLLRRRLTLLGPAFIAAVAYVDPGNVATNLTAGAQFGYTLVWVIVLANLMAVLLQYLSAKLGLVTRRSLAAQVGGRVSPRTRFLYWLQAEGIAIATDLAEVIGGAIAFQLLFGVPLPIGAVLTALVAMVVLTIGDRRGQGALERLIIGFLLLIAVGFLAGLVVGPPSAAGVAGGLVPRFDGAESVLLASGIVGATVMPHAVYLHSSLTADRLGRRGEDSSVRELLAATRTDVVLALILAGVLNLGLLLMAAANLQGMPGTDTIAGAHELIGSEIGAGVALLFAVALLGSGISSTSVGSAAGAEVMRSLTPWALSPLTRRLITLVPALVILMLGIDPTRALVVSQVVLSMGIPFAVVPLVWLTSSRGVMGEYVNHRATTALAVLAAGAIVVLNLVLLWLTFGG